eukprot:787460-Pleurochrysis_carterae.AAC.1
MEVTDPAFLNAIVTALVCMPRSSAPLATCSQPYYGVTRHLAFLKLQNWWQVGALSVANGCGEK